MGTYDGVEVCELVGSLLLYQLSNKYNKMCFGLHRDDGLAVLKNKSGPQAESIKKDFQKNFQRNDLNIVIKCNLKIVNYLDVTVNLVNNTYKHFSKPKNEIIYIIRNRTTYVYNQTSTFFNRVTFIKSFLKCENV